MDGDPLQHLRVLTGTWTSEGTHPLLPGAPVRGRAEFAELEGGHFLTWRSAYEHPDVPDALAVLGFVDGRPAMHYSDARGVHRRYGLDAFPGGWRTWLDEPGFAQGMTATLDGTGDAFTTRGEYSRDGVRWEQDLTLVYRRVGTPRR